MIYVNDEPVIHFEEDPSISKDIEEPSSITDEGSDDQLPLC